MTDQKIIKDFVEAMNQSKKGTSPYDTTATVVRVEGSTAWVHIPGGVDETPVAMSINAKPGDTVRVRVAGGQAWTVGNDSAPPTDDTAATLAQIKADEVNGYLHTHLSLKDDGLYVLSDKSGWSVRVANDGIYLISEDGDTVAQYKDEIRIGRKNGSAVNISSKDIEMLDGSGKSIFDAHLSNGENGTARAGTTFVVPNDGWTGMIMVAHPIYDVVGVSRIDDPTIITVPTVVDDYTVNITTPLSAGTYNVIYDTMDTLFHFRLGTTWSADVGDGATMIGGENAAVSQYSTAIGYGCLANYNAQIAVGRWNAIDMTGESAFIIGNGNGHYGRSDALSVTWSGDVHAAGDVEDGNGNVLANKAEASDVSALQTEQLYSVVRYSYEYTCPASGTVNITKNDLGISVPSGYRIAGYIGISTGNADVVPRSWNPQATATGTTIPLRNLTTAQKTGTLAVDVLYLKTSRGTLTT